MSNWESIKSKNKEEHYKYLDTKFKNSEINADSKAAISDIKTALNEEPEHISTMVTQENFIKKYDHGIWLVLQHVINSDNYLQNKYYKPIFCLFGITNKRVVLLLNKNHRKTNENDSCIVDKINDNQSSPNKEKFLSLHQSPYIINLTQLCFWRKLSTCLLYITSIYAVSLLVGLLISKIAILNKFIPIHITAYEKNILGLILIIIFLITYFSSTIYGALFIKTSKYLCTGIHLSFFKSILLSIYKDAIFMDLFIYLVAGLIVILIFYPSTNNPFTSSVFNDYIFFLIFCFLMLKFISHKSSGTYGIKYDLFGVFIHEIYKNESLFWILKKILLKFVSAFFCIFLGVLILNYCFS